MFSFVGYNFCHDIDALNYSYTPIVSIDNISITNGIYDCVNIEAYNSESITGKPVWNYNTLFFADFDCTSENNGSLDAGNVGYIAGKISGIKIKKRIKGEFHWVTVYEFPVNSSEDLTFSYYDYSCQSGKEYDIAVVIMLNDVEGEYIADTVLSKFDGSYLVDSTGSFKLIANYENGTITVHSPTAIIETASNKYPYVIQNGDVKYQNGSTKCLVVTDEAIEYGNNGITDIYEVDLQQKLLNFLTNGETKIFKDSSGNTRLINIVDNPSIEDFEIKPLININFNWVEVGDVNNEDDLLLCNINYKESE